MADYDSDSDSNSVFWLSLLVILVILVVLIIFIGYWLSLLSLLVILIWLFLFSLIFICFLLNKPVDNSFLHSQNKRNSYTGHASVMHAFFWHFIT